MRKLWKMVAVALSFSLLLIGCGSGQSSESRTSESNGSSQAQTAPKKRVGLILGIGGLGDQGYNDLVYKGVERAKKELNIEFDYTEPKQISEFELIMRDMAGSKKYDVVIGVGFDQVDPMKKVSAEFPEQQFAIIDGNVESPNVASYVCKEEEGSFLVGAIAGLATAEGNTRGLSPKLGFVGALDIPLIQKFNAGFQAGAKLVNPKAEVIVDFVSGDQAFSDTATAKEIALSQNKKGASVIFHAAGGSGLGVFQAAKEAGFLAIGCNQNQIHIDPAHIFASMLKRVDTASFNVVKAACIDRNLAVGATTTLGVKEEGVGYTIEGAEFSLSPENMKTVETLRERIAKGEIAVPATVAEVEDFLKQVK